MVGIKVVELAWQRKIPCTLIDGAPYLFPLAAFPDVAQRIQDFLTGEGIALAFSALLEKIVPSSRAGTREAGRRHEGRASIPRRSHCHLHRHRANTALVRDTSVALNRGILVDRGMRTNCPHLYAAGDCCEGYELQSGDRRVIGLWANAGYQGRTAGENHGGGQRRL